LEIPADLLYLPLLHVDSFVAAGQNSVVLSDYQAITRTFPIAFQPSFSPDQQRTLQLLDAAQTVPLEDLQQLFHTLPVPVDYIVVVGDSSMDTARETPLRRAISIIETSAKREVAGELRFVRIFH
jgi:hypothetical protein